MDLNDWDLIARLLEEALRLPPNERSDYLDEGCRGRPNLKQELLSLLADYDAARAFCRDAISFSEHSRREGRDDEPSEA